MIAAFMVEYVYNPDSAKQKSPWFFDYFQAKMRSTEKGYESLKAIHRFGMEARALHANTGGPLRSQMSVVQYSPTWTAKTKGSIYAASMAVESFNMFEMGRSAYNHFAYHILDKRHPLFLMIDNIGEQIHGKEWEKEIYGRENPKTLITGWGGFDDAFWTQVKNGARSIRTNRRISDIGLGDISANLNPIAERTGKTLHEIYQLFESFMIVQSAVEDIQNNWEWGLEITNAYKDSQQLDLEMQKAEESYNELAVQYNAALESNDAEAMEIIESEMMVLEDDIKAAESVIAENNATIQKYSKKIGYSLLGKDGKNAVYKIGGKSRDIENYISKKIRQKLKNITGIGKGLVSDEKAINDAWKELNSTELSGFLTPEDIMLFKETAEMWRSFASDMILQPLVDSNRMSTKVFNEIKEDRQFYTTMKRVLEDDTLGAGADFNVVGAKKALANASITPSRRMGSEQDIKPPTEAMMEAAYYAQWEAQRNLAGKAIVSMVNETQKEFPPTPDKFSEN